MTVDSPFLQALNGEKPARTPVWLMRQAGRYMPSYQAVKANADFVAMIETPELAAEVTLQPVDELGVDAAILFSDILVTATALGVPFHYVEAKGPLFESPIRHLAQIQALNCEGANSRLHYVFDAIKLLISPLNQRHIPLIGFAGAPLTVGAFMVEGQSPKQMFKFRSMLNQSPQDIHLLLDKLADSTIQYLTQQIKSGVSAIQLFDTLADQLSYDDFKRFSFPYLHKILTALPADCPKILFCKGTDRFLKDLVSLPIQGLSIDWQSNFDDVLSKIPSSICVQGALDPHLIAYPPDDLERRVKGMVSKGRSRQGGYIFNLGHGVLKQTDQSVVESIVRWVHETS